MNIAELADGLAEEVLIVCRAQIVTKVKEAVAAEVGAIKELLPAMIGKAMAEVPKPKDGQDGKDADPELIERMVGEQIEKRLESVEKPKGVDFSEVTRLIREAQQETYKNLPPVPPTPKDGQHGASAYDIAKRHGFNGTEAEWLESLKGKDGTPGKDGKDGLHGKDAFEDAVLLGFVGTKKEWLESLRGKDGSDGVSGKDGADGINGKDGAPGQSAYEIAKSQGFDGTVDQWIKSLRGPRGESGIGEKGMDGRDGRDGVDGRPGRDGANVADPAALLAGILPSIDLKSSYRAGTLAKHAGGLILAEKQTDGDGSLGGWSVLSRGIASVECERGADERSLILKLIGTDDVATEFELTIPATIYRGIFEMETEYKAGDVVTYNGSTWHCNDGIKGRVPGTSKDWTLMVKKGKDAK